jgi:hypothetical protein
LIHSHAIPVCPSSCDHTRCRERLAAAWCDGLVLLHEQAAPGPTAEQSMSPLVDLPRLMGFSVGCRRYRLKFFHKYTCIYVAFDLNPRVHGSEFRVQGLEFKVQGSGFRVQGSGFRV